MLDDIIHPDENCRAPKIKDSKMCLNIKVPSTYARWLISLLGGRLPQLLHRINTGHIFYAPKQPLGISSLVDCLNL